MTTHSDVPFVSLCEGPIYFTDQIAQGRRARPRGARHGDGRPQPRLLERQARVQGRRRDAARGRGLGAAQGRSRAHRRPAPAAAHRGRDGRHPRRLLPVLLLPGRGARRAAGQADDARRGHPRLVDRLLGALRRAGRERRSAARPEVLARRHPRARARDRRDGRGLQREGRGATVNVPNTGGMLPGFDETLVVELLGRCGGPDGWIQPLPVPAPLPGARARPRARAGRVPGAGRRRRLVGHAARRHPRARRAPADGRPRPHRARLRRARARAPRAPARAPAAA